MNVRVSSTRREADHQRPSEEQNMKKIIAAILVGAFAGSAVQAIAADKMEAKKDADKKAAKK